jgi:hypothetical protein
MKASAVALAVILASLVLAQTSAAQSSAPIVKTFYGNGQLAGFMPCLNHGKGEWVFLTTAKQSAILSETITAGAQNGSYMWTPTDPHGAGLTGLGASTGILYTARGASQLRFTNWTPDAPGSVGVGDGQFVQDDDYYVSSSSPALNYIWHQTTRFEITDNGKTGINHPVETVCR